MPRTFTHPEPLKIRNSPGSAEHVTHEFVVWMDACISDPRVTSGGIRSIRAANRFVDAISATKPGDQIKIDDGDFELLKPIIENPQAFSMNVWIARHLYVWNELVLAAVEEK